MKEKLHKIIRVSIRALTVLFACAGLYVTFFTKAGGFMGGSSLSFYTIQSNIWVLCMALASIVIELAGAAEPSWFKVLRHVLTVAIMVTFLVFWAMLAPTMPPGYLVSVSNITLHTLVPLLALADLLYCDRGHVSTKKQVLFCTLPPLLYFGFAMLRPVFTDTLLLGTSRYPYWFLDVDKLGWFGLKNGVGVFYWVLVVVAIVLGLGYLLRFIKVKLTKTSR